jgi:hypothetical protein
MFEKKVNADVTDYDELCRTIEKVVREKQAQRATAEARVRETEKIVTDLQQRKATLTAEIANHAKLFRTADPAKMGEMAKNHEKQLAELPVVEAQLREMSGITLNLTRDLEDANYNVGSAVRQILRQEAEKESEEINRILADEVEPKIKAAGLRIAAIQQRFKIPFGDLPEERVSVQWKNDIVFQSCADYQTLRSSIAMTASQIHGVKGPGAPQKVWPVTAGGNEIRVI